MREPVLGLLLSLAALGGILFVSQVRMTEAPALALSSVGQGPVLERFRTAAAFDRYVRDLQSAARRNAGEAVVYDMAMPSLEAPAVQYEAPAEAANPEITNNQTAGVDEGGIVKQIGRHLVVLQDGRVFSADLGEGEGAPLRLADRIDVYRSPATAADWYDEMLVLGDRILVTAYNYREQASEITVLRLAADGRLSREGRYLLSSADYYSTENYATRLVGDNLVFYAPMPLLGMAPGADFRWPRIRRADGDGDADAGEALIGPTDVYAPPGRTDYPVLHTLSVCPLRENMDCRTTAFVGPAMRELYVSPTDAFLWIGAPDGLPWSIDYANQRRRSCPANMDMAASEPALLYRIPLDGGGIGAVAVDGIPADQFSFESRDGRFRALLGRAPGDCREQGQAMPLALLDLPLSAFGARIRHVSDQSYAALPPVEAGMLENRFVGDWLIYGGRDRWGGLPSENRAEMPDSTLIAVPVARPADAVRLRIPHNAIRIERAGGDAVVTGYRNRGGLSLSYVRLDRAPRVAATAMLPGRFESEGRSHAFNAWIRRDGTGVIGLPTSRREWRAGRGWSDSESSALSFVAVGADKTLGSIGELHPRAGRRAGAYRCQVSCIDWYGNSRPVFTGGRIFALMGTDLVEGGIADGRIAELGRVDLTGPPG